MQIGHILRRFFCAILVFAVMAIQAKRAAALADADQPPPGPIVKPQDTQGTPDERAAGP